MRVRGPDRAIAAVGLALFLTWALHAAVDFDWETPALTAPVLLVGGAMLARRTVPTAMRSRLWLRPALGLLVVLCGVCASLVAVSQFRLDRASTAYLAGDCRTATLAAADARSILPVRPEPLAILGWCASQRGERLAGVALMEQAVARDPGNWRFHYGAALVRARAGLDPRPETLAALRRNPLSGDLNEARRQFGRAQSGTWGKVSGRLLPMPLF